MVYGNFLKIYRFDAKKIFKGREMKVRELIERLEKFDPEMVVSILDGFNGGGQSREINYTPEIDRY